MNSLFENLAGDFAGKFFVYQVITILIIMAAGFVICLAVEKKDSSLMSTILISYPVGLVVFEIEAYVMLVLGIPFNNITVLILGIITVGIFAVAGAREEKFKNYFSQVSVKVIIITLLASVVLACIACSGLFPISLSNDSMYRSHEYPRYIVYFGSLRDQFDTMLTDTGLGSVSICTLPFLFGFDESFGIREFMHMDFIIYFAYMVYERLIKIFENNSETAKKSACFKAVALSFIVGAILMFSAPAWILGHWDMANMYFMEFFFMAAMEGIRLHGKSHKLSEALPMALFAVGCALTRAEGGIFVLLLVVCLTLLDIDVKQITYLISIPVILLVGAYSAKIYLIYTIDNPYTFLTPGKALMQAAAFGCVIVYMIFIKSKLPEKINRYTPEILIAGLVMMNAVLLLYNSELYITNLKTFYLNLMRQSGWGILPELTFGAIIILIVMYVRDLAAGKKSKRDIEDVFFLVLTVGFLLATIVVSFMRGDPLDVQVGDSGNRVLLQIVPFLIYTLMLYFVRLYERERE